MCMSNSRCDFFLFLFFLFGCVLFVTSGFTIAQCGLEIGQISCLSLSGAKITSMHFHACFLQFGGGGSDTGIWIQDLELGIQAYFHWVGLEEKEEIIRIFFWSVIPKWSWFQTWDTMPGLDIFNLCFNPVI
jgi:hypothetical protein